MKILFIAAFIILLIALYLYRSRYEIPGFTIYDTKQEAEFERIRLKIIKCKTEKELTLCILNDLKKFQQEYNDIEALHQRNELINLIEAKDKALIVDHNTALQDQNVQTA